jgi:hypothetical protein
LYKEKKIIGVEWDIGKHEATSTHNEWGAE